MEENTQLPKEVVIPADKVAFMKESIEKLRATNKSDYKAGDFDSFNHKYEGRYNAFEEVLQWANPLKFYEEEKEILLEEITNLSKELQEKDAQLQDAKEKIKVLTYDNNRLKGEVEGLKVENGAKWIKADTKPEHNVGVLVFIPGEDNHITSGMWDISNQWVLLDEYRTPEEEVTHWMPLPAFPEGYTWNEIPDDLVDALKKVAKEELTAINPELLQVIRDADKSKEDDLKAVKEVIGGAAGREEDWISVDERLPYRDGDSSVYCLVNDTYDGIVVRPFNEAHQCWDQEDGDDYYTDAKGGKITHWKPLPEPPQT